MPRRKPISPTVAPMYADSRAPAASTSSTSPAGAPRPDDTNTTAPTYATPKTAHASACHTRRAPARGRHRPVPALPRRAALGHQALADAGDPHLLAGRRGGGDGEQVPRQAVGLRAALLGVALDRRPPRRRQHRRQREHREQHQRRVDRHQQRDRDAEPQDPAAGGEQRHVHVVEHEHLVAQHRQPVEVLGPLLVRDGRDRRLQPGDVRLERDRHLVAEAALHARADRAEEPGRRRRHAEADRRAPHQAAVVLEHAVAEQLEPQREQRVGQRGEQRQHERREHQPRLVAVAELAQPPHRRQRRRQGVDRAIAAQARTSYVVPSSSSAAVKRCACRSNIVR